MFVCFVWFIVGLCVFCFLCMVLFVLVLLFVSVFCFCVNLAQFIFSVGRNNWMCLTDVVVDCLFGYALCLVLLLCWFVCVVFAFCLCCFLHIVNVLLNLVILVLSLWVVFVFRSYDRCWFVCLFFLCYCCLSCLACACCVLYFVCILFLCVFMLIGVSCYLSYVSSFLGVHGSFKILSELAGMIELMLT